MGAQQSTQPVVLVTMSTSLIGTYTIAALSTEYQVVALTPQPPAQPLREVDWIVCDLTGAQSITEGLAAVRRRHGDHLASVLHLATYAEFSGEPRPLPRALVVDGTRRLLQGLQEFAVEQSLFAGSLFVMHPATDPHAVLTETSPTASHPNAIVRLRINIVLPFTTTTKRVWQPRQPPKRGGQQER